MNAIVRFCTIGLLITAIAFVSCNNNEEINIGKIAAGYIDSLYNGDYDGAAAHTAGSREASARYNEHLAILYRNAVENNTQEHGRLVRSECTAVKEYKDYHSADVYLRLTFADSTRQDILLPMEEHSGQWLMK